MKEAEELETGKDGGHGIMRYKRGDGSVGGAEAIGERGGMTEGRGNMRLRIRGAAGGKMRKPETGDRRQQGVRREGNRTRRREAGGKEGGGQQPRGEQSGGKETGG